MGFLSPTPPACQPVAASLAAVKGLCVSGGWGLSLDKSLNGLPIQGPNPCGCHTRSDSLLLLFSRLVMCDYNFQVFYDVMMVQVSLFMTYVLLRDSYKAGK